MTTLTRILAPGESLPDYATPATGISTVVVEDESGCVVEIWRRGERVFSVLVHDADLRQQREVLNG